MPKLKTINRALIRSLLIQQNGRCAISGQKIKPSNVALDHIIPVSRREYSKKKGYGSAWLVTRKVNALKGSLTIDELYKVISQINNNKKKTKKLLDAILNNKIKETTKEDFDIYVKKNYDKDGEIKK